MSSIQRLDEMRLTEFFSVLLEELRSISGISEEKAYAVNRQVQRAKKRAGYFNPTLEPKAIEGFVTLNHEIGHARLALDSSILANARYFITTVLERYTLTLDEEAIQTPLLVSELFNNWRFGPGASNGVKGTHAAQKIQQPMTCTSLSEPFVRKLRLLNPYFCVNDGTRNGINVVNGSRLATVPKNEDTVRTIAIEPSGSMAMQLAAGRYLEGALRMIGLDISTQQPKNKAMALRGSLDGSLATIDLKSASDMISINLVRQLMPCDWFGLLVCLRSPNIDVKGHGEISLNMISTMGNGFTFPLMTLIIVALIYGLRCINGGPSLFIDWRDTAVFGDDIIVPANEYVALTKVLTDAGLVVNHDKSYSEGPFRESCGGDYYKGYDVTPFYVKHLSTPADIYVAINQVLDWCGKHDFILHRTLLLLKSYLGAKVFLIPEWYNPDQGVLTARCSRRFSYLSQSPRRFRLTPGTYDMMLAVGGYVVPSGPDLFYTPRAARLKMCVRASRLPNGYLDGHDPLTRSCQLSERISSITDILFR